ncbi:MAG: hypothetical protein H6842_04690 [Rhodospirillaceae bacterium]|nr:hypothetical protein [Rhodospirillaceae bacterium]
MAIKDHLFDTTALSDGPLTHAELAADGGLAPIHAGLNEPDPSIGWDQYSDNPGHLTDCCHHQPRGLPPDNGRLIPARLAWEHFGVTSMTLHRWLRDPRLDFPRPVFIGRYRYFYLSEIQQWERSRPRTSPLARADAA